MLSLQNKLVSNKIKIKEIMRKIRVLTIVTVIVLMASSMFNACKKEDSVQNETGITNQQKSANHVVVITDEERKHLGDPMPADLFSKCSMSFINMTTKKLKCIFVVSVNEDGTVQNEVVGQKSFPQWHHRLKDYFENPISGCRFTQDKDELNAWTKKFHAVKTNYCVSWDEEAQGWYVLSDISQP
jgi:hypothetical protein